MNAKSIVRIGDAVQAKFPHGWEPCRVIDVEYRSPSGMQDTIAQKGYRLWLVTVVYDGKQFLKMPAKLKPIGR